MKQLRSRSKIDFDREVEALRLFRNDTDQHLIKLLATYHDGEFYSMIFPWADKNLRDYWEYDPRPANNYDTILWSMTQCSGIAEALRKIHYSQFQRQRDNRNVLNMPRMGRHGDIKPENILWFPPETGMRVKNQGILALSDFGLARFHRVESAHRLYYRELAASPTYRAPESDLNGFISPSWDIWTLGCVYLEFLIWYLQGWAAVDKFSEHRLECDSAPYAQEDKYFTLDEKAEFGAYRKSPVIRVSDKHRYILREVFQG